MINLIQEENKKIKEALDATAQAKVDSGKWQATNNNGQTVIYPTGYTPFNAYPKSSSSSPKPVSNTSSMISELAALQKKQKQVELERAKEAALSNLTAEGKSTNERYRTDINSTATDRDIQLKNFFENTANRGQTNSGSTSQAEISQGISKQNAISGLRTAKENALSDIERRKSLAEQGYLDDVNSANTTIDIARYQNLVDLQKEQEKNALIAEQNAFERQQAQDKMAVDIGDYNRLKTSNYDTSTLEQKNASELAKIKFDQDLKQANLLAETGDFSGLKALGIDPTYLQKKWNADIAETQSQTSNRGKTATAESKSKAPTVYTNALKMKNETESLKLGEQAILRNVYGNNDIVNYVQSQGLTDEEEYDILTKIGVL